MIEKYATLYLSRKNPVGTAEVGTDKYNRMIAGGWVVTATWTAIVNDRGWTISDYTKYERV